MVQAFRSLADRPDPAGVRLLLDGVHLVRDAHRAGLTLDLVAVAETEVATSSDSGRLARALDADGIDVVCVSDRVLRAISPVQHPAGIVAIASRAPVTVSTLCTPDALLVVAVDVQDPGNLGALVRAAEAAGATGVMAAGSTANPFSWKALRGSMGGTLRLPVVSGLDTDEALSWLARAGLRLIASVARGGDEPEAIDWRAPCALLLGGEGPGLPSAIVARADARVTIPMHHEVESLNVAVAGGILCYEARRQRRGRPLTAAPEPRT
jgi:RNA methyltransferase, TrmH family